MVHLVQLQKISVDIKISIKFGVKCSAIREIVGCVEIDVSNGIIKVAT